jgi:A/G-specific adenine glycosylase
MQKRTRKDIWQTLYEFPLIEHSETIGDVDNLISIVENVDNLNLLPFKVLKKSKPFKQILTHQKIVARFWEIEVDKAANFDENKYLKIERKNLSKFAFPKVVDLYLNDKSLTLELF